MELVKIPLVVIFDHTNVPIRPNSSVGALSDFVVEFNYSYKEGDENDTAELRIIFDDIDVARQFKFVPGLHWKIRYGYETGLSNVRDLVVDKVNKKAHSPGIVIDLVLIPLAEYEGRVLPMDHTTAKQRLALLIERDIEIDIKLPYDRNDIIVVNSDINSPSKKFDPLNDKYYSVRPNSPDKLGIWDNVKSVMKDGANPEQGALGFEARVLQERYGVDKKPLWDNGELIGNILSWQKDMKEKLGMAEVHVRDGKVIVQDRDLEAVPIMSIVYGDDNLISWETEETDLEVETESEYQAVLNAELKKQDIVKVSTLGATELKVMHIGNTTRVVDENGVTKFTEDVAYPMKVFKHGEDYYTLTDDFEFAQKVSAEMVPFIEQQINFTWTKVMLKEKLTLLGYKDLTRYTRDLSYTMNPVTNLLGNLLIPSLQDPLPMQTLTPLSGDYSTFTESQRETYEKMLKEKYPLSNIEQAKIDIQQDNLQQGDTKFQGVSQRSLTEWAHANAQTDESMGPWDVDSEKDMRGPYDTYMNQQGYRETVSRLNPEDKTLIGEITTHSPYYSDGYIRRRLANVVASTSPLELRGLVDSFLNDTMEAELHKKKLKLVIEGNPIVEISQTIVFEGLDEYDTGTYYIIESDHKITSSGYTTEITALKIPPSLTYITEQIEKEFGEKVRVKKLKVFNKAYKQWKDEMAKGFKLAKDFGFKGTIDDFTVMEEYDHAYHAEITPVVKEVTETIIEVKSNPLEYVGDSYSPVQIQTYDGPDVANALLQPGVKAALDTIAWAEGTIRFGSAGGYDVFFTGKTLDDYGLGYGWHPNKAHSIQNSKGKSLVSTACGRYQFLYTTWQGLATTLGLESFEPENQDKAAVGLLVIRKVLAHFEKANIDAALMQKQNYKGALYPSLALEWASFPNGPYGQSERTEEQIRAVYADRLQHYLNNP